MMWTGPWKRPHSYGPDPAAEARHVHDAVGADRRLDPRQDPRHRPRRRRVPRPRLPEPASPTSGRPHSIRRPHGRRGPDHGRRRRRAARRRDVLRDDHLDRGGRRLPVVHVVERGLVHGRPLRPADRRRLRRQRRRPARARADAAGLDRRLLERGLRRTSTPGTSGVAGVPCLALRIGFVGELGYELHFPSPLAEHVWDTLLEQGRGSRGGAVRPRAAADPPAREGPRDRQPGHRLGVEPPRGGDAVAREDDKEFDWVGKWATQSGRRAGAALDARRLREPQRRDAVEGGQVVVDGRPVGPRHVRAALRGARQGDRARDRPAASSRSTAARFAVQVNGRPVAMRVHLGPFFDPAGERLKA